MVGGIQRLPVNDRALAYDFDCDRNGDMVDGIFLRFIRGASGAGAVRMNDRIMMIGTERRKVTGAEK